LHFKKISACPFLQICHWCQRYQLQIVATGINNTGSKFATNVKPVANNGNNIRLLTPESKVEEKKYIYRLTLLPKSAQTK
jgi:hypothetical protein